MRFTKVFNLTNYTLLTALVLSSIAAWYSILGLIAIFPGAPTPIIVMGGALEVAKVVTTVWLHRYWDKCGPLLKLYLVPAVISLAMLTSMGIFGFLSKAHIDQNVSSGDVVAKVSIIDEKIKTQRENIEVAKKAIEQMNSQVDQRLSRSDSEQAAERAVQIRRQQAPERVKLAKEITEAQKQIAALNEERAPIAGELRKVEAEVGPIKYIAALIYGDNPDQNILERAVRWVIILIVFVFDPLALTLVIASNTSRQWMNEDEPKPRKKEEDMIGLPVITDIPPMPNVKPPKLEEPIVSTEPDPEPEIVPEPIAATPEPKEAPIVKDVAVEGITKEKPYKEMDGDYVSYEGKLIHRNALKEMKPEFFTLTADSAIHSTSSFGTKFPTYANKGDTFVRVDFLPNKAYKFDGNRWIEIVKEQTDNYLHDTAYIQYLISKIDAGEYDVSLLSDVEKQKIEDYLKNNSNQ